jgi:hypothetical protein
MLLLLRGLAIGRSRWGAAKEEALRRGEGVPRPTSVPYHLTHTMSMHGTSDTPNEGHNG